MKYWAFAFCTILLATVVAKDAAGQSSVAQTHVAAAKEAAIPQERGCEALG